MIVADVVDRFSWGCLFDDLELRMRANILYVEISYGKMIF